MKNLVISQPDDPINFLINILQKPPTNKIFFTGPPGYKSGKSKIAEEISQKLNFVFVSSGELLREEINK